MALVKTHKQPEVQESGPKSVDEAKGILQSNQNSEESRLEALDFLISKLPLVEILDLAIGLFYTQNDITHHIFIDHIFTQLLDKPKTDDEFARMLKMLQSQNVYLRNMVIKYLQEYGSEARKFVKMLMDSNDKDLRIFAINILGDVNYEESVEMLRYFIALEQDINAMMTAVDYLGEIGSTADIELLESLKQVHGDNPYVCFGVDTAIERIRG